MESSEYQRVRYYEIGVLDMNYQLSPEFGFETQALRDLYIPSNHAQPEGIECMMVFLYHTREHRTSASSLQRDDARLALTLVLFALHGAHPLLGFPQYTILATDRV